MKITLSRTPKICQPAGKATYHIQDGTQILDTGYSLNETAAATAALEFHRRAKATPLAKTAVKMVLEWVHSRGGQLTPWRQSMAGRPNFSEPLLSYFDKKSVGQVPGEVKNYIAWRTSQPSPAQPGAKIKKTTAFYDLIFLQRSVDSYCAHHDIKSTVKIPIKLPQFQRSRYLNRAEAARLIKAARGYVYDSMTGTWSKHPDYETVSAERAYLVRSILIGLYSGSTDACCQRLQWAPDPSDEVSYVDLKAEQYGVRGWLYRLGKDEAPGKAAGMPVPLTKRLRGHLLRWKKLDASGEHVFIVRAGSSVANWFLMQQTADDADLDDFTVDVLRRTNGAWLMQAGSTVRRAALFMGMTPKSVDSNFRQFSPRLHAKAIAGLTKLSPAVLTAAREIP